jgi:adenylate cyclase
MGERKLKGLENPEYIYLMYPHSLAGRIYYQPQLQADSEESQNAKVPPPVSEPRVEELSSKDWGAKLSIEPEAIWTLWKISLRLEMLVTMLEEGKGAVLRKPQYDVLDKVKLMAGDVTDEFLIGFLTHLVTRAEVRPLHP